MTGDEASPVETSQPQGSVNGASSRERRHKGYEAGFRITNVGTATINGWRLEFDLPAGQVVTSSWEGVDAPLGQHHVVVNRVWNGTLVPGATVTFGYVARFTGAYAPPTNCTIFATVTTR